MSDEVVEKLDTLIRLFAISICDDKAKSQKDKILLLGAAGMPSKDIAELLGTTANTVSVTLSKRKNVRKKRTSRLKPSGEAG